MKDRREQAFPWIIAFFMLSLFVARQAVRPADLWVMQQVQSFAARELDYFMYLFTVIGSIEFSCFALLVVTWYLYRKYEWTGVFLYLFFFIALSGVEFVWKYIVTYTAPGPDFDRNPFHWRFILASAPYSFPSGHTFRSVFLLGIWYDRLTLTSSFSRPAIWFQKIMILFLIFGIGASRIYLGDHWLSDVVGGYLLAVIGLILASQSPHFEFKPA